MKGIRSDEMIEKGIRRSDLISFLEFGGDIAVLRATQMEGVDGTSEVIQELHKDAVGQYLLDFGRNQHAGLQGSNGYHIIRLGVCFAIALRIQSNHNCLAYQFKGW